MNSKWMGMSTLLATVLSSTLLLSACDSDSDTSAPESTIVVSSSAYSNAEIQPLTAYSEIVRYKMTGINHQSVEANTVVLVPTGTQPEGGWPVVVWAHGTTGVADSCAPSQKADFAGAETGTDTNALIAAFLQKGYAVVAPDYEGLGVDGIHPYLNLKSEADSIISALKAAHEIVGSLSDSWVVVGHSQGGQAALGAAQYADIAGFDFKGAVAVAPASQFLAILAGGGALADQLVAVGDIAGAVKILASQNAYAALAAASVKAGDSQFDYGQIFGASTESLAEQAESICAPELGLAFGQSIQNYYMSNAASGAAISSYPGLMPTFNQVAEVSDFLQAAEPGSVQLSEPVLLIQGDADTTVPATATQGLKAKMDALGTEVSYLNVAGASHGGALDQSTTAIVDFVSKQFVAE